MHKPTQPTLDETIALTIESLRAHANQHPNAQQPWRSTHVAERIARREQHEYGYEWDARRWELAPLALEAAWELVRRGILRPGLTKYPTVGSGDGTEFALTQRGRAWIESADEQELMMLQPGALAKTLAEYANLYGPGYLQRIGEAIKARNAQAHLACCAMSGAGAESILLSLAIAQHGDEETVLKSYNSRSGRSSVIRALTGRAVETVRTRFVTYSEILHYWRDDAAHGVASTISDAHAEEALSRLLRLAQFSADHWSDLTGKSRPRPSS